MPPPTPPPGPMCSTPEGIGAGITCHLVCQARAKRGRCSTPEGIGAGITRTRDCTRSDGLSGAQRPKASERELLEELRGLLLRPVAVLNARRHRSGNYRAPTTHRLGACGAQRPKASERELPERQAGLRPRAERHVLNARRHRSGNYRVEVEAGCGPPRAVLNARRHRSGNYPARVQRRRVAGPVLNARRHRSGNYSSFFAPIAFARFCAQRPKASERELLRRDVQRPRRGALSVLNARRHRSGNYQPCRRSPIPSPVCAQRPKASERELPRRRTRCWTSPRECSTPEGIGAGITRASRRSRARRRCAQRPKASERELLYAAPVVRIAAVRCSTPEGIGAGITLLPATLEVKEDVLNARRHRSGN